MIHWFIFNFAVMLVTGLVLLERYFRFDTGIVPILAGILFFVTLIIFIKDIITIRG